MAEDGDPAAQYVYGAVINGLPHYPKALERSTALDPEGGE
jgi:hypothetical protein